MKKLLIIAHNWPAPNYSAAGIRLMQLVDFFQNDGFQITIASTADKSMVKNSDFKNIELKSILLNDSGFDVYIRDLNPDMVLFDRFLAEEQFGWRVAENAPNALRILDTEDLHSLRKTREEALKENNIWSSNLWLQHDLTKREVASILRCDLSLIISSFEIELLKDIISNHEELLLHLPFMIDEISSKAIKKWKTFDQRKDFIFIGFGGHLPNIDAINYLKKEIWPMVRTALPEANLNIYGGYLPKKIYELHSEKEGFLIQGWVENATKVISDARILLAPLRFGAGQKGKLLDAMRFGTPSVTTKIGAEAMHNNLKWNGIICDDPKSIAQAAKEIYTNSFIFDQFQKNGIKIIAQNFEKNNLEIRLKTKLNQIQKDIGAHRDKNFIGSLIQHQTLASTKFMSKWIEEKNKKK